MKLRRSLWRCCLKHNASLKAQMVSCGRLKMFRLTPESAPEFVSPWALAGFPPKKARAGLCPRYNHHLATFGVELPRVFSRTFSIFAGPAAPAPVRLMMNGYLTWLWGSCRPARLNWEESLSPPWRSSHLSCPSWCKGWRCWARGPNNFGLTGPLGPWAMLGWDMLGLRMVCVILYTYLHSSI